VDAEDEQEMDGRESRRNWSGIEAVEPAWAEVDVLQDSDDARIAIWGRLASTHGTS
jgi:hypothetical protein